VIRRLQVSDPRFARLRTAVRTEPRARATAFVVIAGILTAIALLIAPPASVTYSVGAVADRAIRAPRSVSFVSESLTEAERDKAEAAVQKQLTTDPAVFANASTRVATAASAATPRCRATGRSRRSRVSPTSPFHPRSRPTSWT